MTHSTPIPEAPVEYDLTQDELVAALRERFGNDPKDWAFECTSCHDVATIEDFRQALADHPREDRDKNPVIASAVIGQECIGRTLGALKATPKAKYEGRGCDWAAFGLIPGPLRIQMPGGRVVHSFPMAPAPEPQP